MPSVEISALNADSGNNYKQLKKSVGFFLNMETVSQP